MFIGTPPLTSFNNAPFLTRSPEKGQLVEELNSLDHSQIASLPTLFDLSPNLLYVGLVSDKPGGVVNIFTSAPSTWFTSLRCLSLSAPSISDTSRKQFLDLEFLDWLARCPTLEELRLEDWFATDLKVEGRQRQLKLRTLALYDAFNRPKNTVPTIDILTLCPHLETLKVEWLTTRSISLQQIFDGLQAPLRRLEVQVRKAQEPIDPLLVRLPSLRSLTLKTSSTETLYSQNLSRNLSHLHQLTHLSLSCLDPFGSIQHVRHLLIDGPYRLPLLRRLELDHDWEDNAVNPGERLVPTIDSQIGWSGGNSESWDWMPSEEYPPLLYQEAKSILKLATSISIELDGGAFSGVRGIDQLLLEAHNLSVGEAFFEEYLGDIKENRERAVDYGFEEPIIEIPEEEREDWELVTTEVIFEEIGSIREERWFSLSLLNKRDGRIMGEWKGV
ncbi:hypothetical protein JCM3765_005287 [Sporobolomyces pararoseus]